MTWTCHICKEERPDDLIGVAKIDTSADFDLPYGTMVQNVRYCKDKPACALKALASPHFRRSAP